jgi:hypothetical protein
MENPKQEHVKHSVELPKCENSSEGLRLRQLGINPDANPIDILMQLFDHYQKLHCTP